MYLRQFFTEGLGHGSYLVADEETGEAAVIDPRRDPDAYLRAAAERGLAIRHVLETHTPNDYVSGAKELAALTGAAYGASGAGGGAGLRFEHRPLKEGDTVRLGAVTLRVWETPGHTPEHLAFLAFAGGAGPTAAFTGGSLLAGGAGRTDLSGGARTGELARAQYESVRRLLALPEHVPVYPTHGGGSLCGSGGGPRWTSVGRERRANELARLAVGGDADAFAARLLADLPVAPANWRRLRVLNRRGPTPLAELGAAAGFPGLLPLRPLAPDGVQALAAGGAAHVVDARDAAAFGGAHVPGSFGVGLGRTFGVWVGSVVPDDRPLVVVLPGAEDALPEVLTALWGEAVRQLLRAGYERIAGYLDGGVRAWAARGLPLRALPQLTAREAWERSRRGERGVLDVRQPGEWQGGHAPGATHVPGATIPDRAAALRDRPWAVACATGYRSTVGASVLLRAGAQDVANVLGGMAAWRAAGLPIEASVGARAPPSRLATPRRSSGSTPQSSPE